MGTFRKLNVKNEKCDYKLLPRSSCSSVQLGQCDMLLMKAHFVNSVGTFWSCRRDCLLAAGSLEDVISAAAKIKTIFSLEKTCNFAVEQDLVWTQPNPPTSVNLFFLILRDLSLWDTWLYKKLRLWSMQYASHAIAVNHLQQTSSSETGFGFLFIGSSVWQLWRSQLRLRWWALSVTHCAALAKQTAKPGQARKCRWISGWGHGVTAYLGDLPQCHFHGFQHGPAA